ncbi:MAG: hypothetical protein WCV64_02755 [Desulfurivibrionaceae bacterium]
MKTDGAITVPPDVSKEFIETIRARAITITQDELAKQGDMTPVDACGPKVMKVTQDITAISMSQNLVVSRGFFGAITQDTKQEVNISTSLKLEDCQTGKLIYSI